MFSVSLSYLSDATDPTANAASCRRVYISRADAPARRIANESEVLAILEPRRFVSVQLSKLSFLEQAKLFSEADVIVAGHGAGLSNIVFCKPGTRIVEIMPPRWMAPCFMSLAAVAKCDYRYVLGEEVAADVVKVPQRADIVAPLLALGGALSDLA